MCKHTFTYAIGA